MAIKIQGSTVIDDSRVATFDTLTLDGTGAIRVPNGTQEERPTPSAGQIRFNTDISTFEGYNGTEWGPLSSSSLLDTLSTAVLTIDTSKLDRNNNLSDLSSLKESRKNLLPSQLNKNDNILFTDGDDVYWDSTDNVFPSVSGNNDKYLRVVNGSIVWDNVFPDFSGNDNKYLKLVSGDLAWSEVEDELARTLGLLGI